MDLDVRLLGPLELEADGALLPLGGPRSGRLLAVLLLNLNSVVTTDRLIEVVWDRGPLSARQQIHNVVAGLRRQLAPAEPITLTSTRLGYRLEMDADLLDLNRFRTAVRAADAAVSAGRPGDAVTALAQARALWRGPALTGLGGRYLDNIAVRLEAERLAATAQHLALRVETGGGEAVAAELGEFVAEHPLHEAARASLMAALYSTGRQAEALQVYEQGRRLLADELGLDPGAELRGLHDSILKGRPLFTAPAVTVPATVPAATPAATAASAPTDTTAPITAAADPATSPANASPAPSSAPPPAATAAESAQVPAAAPSRERYFLPHDSREFSGRQEELAQLARIARRPDDVGLAIAAIDGMGGVGKTALAVRFAHTVAADYPDGQYYIDLRGFTVGTEPLGAIEAFGALLRQSGLAEESLPPDLEGRIAAWRARMHGRKVLILLDNAVDARQVRPLLPGAGGPLVLVTSRRRLGALEGAYLLSLEPMPVDDALTLLTRVIGPDRVGGDREGAVRVLELCGRLPLAIRVVGARLRDRTSWTVPHLVDLLASPPQRTNLLDRGENSVSSVLGLSYRYLSEDRKRLFRLLSIHPGADFTASAAAALAGTTPDRVQPDLESLLDDNLLLQESFGRYRFHDLVRDCATTWCAEHDQDDAADAADRLIDYYTWCAAAWCAPLTRGPFRDFRPKTEHEYRIPPLRTEAESLDHLGREGGNLLAVAYWASVSARPERSWQLITALHPYLRLTGYGEHALYLARAALEAVRAVGDERGESLCLYVLALTHRERSDLDAAQALLELAGSISRRLGDRSAHLYQLTDLGVIMARRGRYGEAYECYQDVLKLAEEEGDDRLRDAVKNNLGTLCGVLGRFDEGLSHLYDVLRSDGLDSGAEAGAGSDSGTAYRFGGGSGSGFDSRSVFGSGSDARPTFGSESGAGSRFGADGRSAFSSDSRPEAGSASVGTDHVLGNLGIVLLGADRYDEAAARLHESAEAAVAARHPHVEAVARASLCVALRAQGDLARAFDEGRRALAVACDSELWEAECLALVAIGEAHLAARDLSAAEDIFTKAEQLSHRRRWSLLEARAREGLAHVALYRGAPDPAPAKSLFEEALEAYPAGSAEAEHARRHLTAPRDQTVRCGRCRR